MSETSTTNIPVPTDLAQELEIEAKRMGLGVPAYLRLVTRAAARRHDEQFLSAARHVFTKYPDTMRKLAK